MHFVIQRESKITKSVAAKIYTQIIINVDNLYMYTLSELNIFGFPS